MHAVVLPHVYSAAKAWLRSSLAVPSLPNLYVQDGMSLSSFVPCVSTSSLLFFTRSVLNELGFENVPMYTRAAAAWLSATVLLKPRCTV